MQSFRRFFTALCILCLILPMMAPAAIAEIIPDAYPKQHTLQSISPLGEFQAEDGTLITLSDIQLASGAASYLQELLPPGSLITVTTPYPPDRYGRLPGQLHIKDAAPEDTNHNWLQARLVGEGLAFVTPMLASPGAIQSLLALEQQAREEERGLWNNPEFAPPARPAGHAHQVRDHYALITGTIRRTATIRTHHYLNFGEDWRIDTTVYIPESAREETEAMLGMALSELKNKTLRIRGIVYDFNGPAITLHHPAQLELVDKQ